MKFTINGILSDTIIMSPIIVLIDDDTTMHVSVRGVLGDEGQLNSFYTIEEAENYFNGGAVPALIIIDRILPDGDGITICSKIRSDERLREVPIIFLSSKGTETDKVGGLFAGADDYITKPVGPLELKARIQARLRAFSKRIFLGNLIIDLSAHRTFLQLPTSSVEIDLTKLEFKILITLAKAPDRVFTRESLIRTAWGDSVNVSDRVVDTHLSHLRKKLKGTNVELESSRGSGYRLSVKVIEPQAA